MTRDGILVWMSLSIMLLFMGVGTMAVVMMT